MSIPSITNCPNCGAPIDGDKCSYCVTRLVNIADLEAGEPIWLIFRDRNFDNVVRGVRVLVTGLDISSIDPDPVVFYADDRKYMHYIKPTQDVTVELSGTLMPNEKGFFGIRLDKNEDEDPEIRHYI